MYVGAGAAARCHLEPEARARRAICRRDLLDEFAAALSRWAWDVALLQEVPPWWPALLAAGLDGDVLAGGFDVDHVFARGLRAASDPDVLDRGRLSDHAPVAVALR